MTPGRPKSLAPPRGAGAQRLGGCMSDVGITALLVVSLFLILGSGVWIGLTLSGVAWIRMRGRRSSWKRRG